MNGMYSNVTVQTSLLRAVFRDYSFPDDWEECWRRLKGKMCKLAWQAIVLVLFVSDSWKDSRQVVQQIYLMAVGKSRERS